MRGQLEISNAQKPIEHWLADAQTNSKLRTQLEKINAIRAYASRELALPDNQSYRTYADLKRDYVLWNVFAADEFSLELNESCFPIAGCVKYRGFFTQQQARAYADKLEAQGKDVYVGGVPAYSTLGWLTDPVLNTFVDYPDVELAALIFHELAHQVVYVKDDSTFNESFATAVEEEGVRRWLQAQASTKLDSDWQRARTRREAFRMLVHAHREQLAAVYAAEIDVPAKRAAKQKLLAQFRQGYEDLIEQWGESKSRSEWLAQSINNAHLASVATYTDLVPSFRRLLQQDNGDFAAFFRRVKQLAAQSKQQRSAQLDGAVAGGE